MKKVKNMSFKTTDVTICYARNGHRLYQGLVSDIPQHILEYYCGYVIVNKFRSNTYIEVTEDKGWWK